ncbi:MAG: dihydrodipicolinate synthase family protein [Melioribacteraceae bacterium]|nr:dihydrodipicolinate synthase family protein [Melioribacteraceae bacterium]
MLKGIFPPIPTPFAGDEISLEQLKNNIEKWNSTGLAGYVVMGSNGESAYLTWDEKIKLVSAAKEYASGNKVIIAGTGSDSIKSTIHLSNKAAEAGADYVLILTPHFYQSKMNHEALLDYFRNVADNIAVPLIIYNVPKFTGVNISSDTVSVLSGHENIIGIKNSSENLAEQAEIIRNVQNDFSVLIGTASVLYPGLCMGACGGIVALSNIAPSECIDIYNMTLKGEHINALDVQRKMLKINKLVTSQFGVAGLKYAMDMLGYYGGLPRKPLQPLTNKERELMNEILTEADLI